MINGTGASNQPQVDYWNGPGGERWTSEQEAHDRSLESFGNAALAKAAPRPGEQVLDIGCGTGATTLALSEAVGPSGKVTGVDISGPMLARAKERAKSLENVAFVQADASLSAFSAAHDLVFSRFGVMFFAEPARAFESLRSALKIGGRLAFVCWRKLAENPWMDLTLKAATRIVPSDEPDDPNAPGPLAFADSTRVATILAEAGFDDILIAPFDADFVLSQHGLDAAVTAAMRIGPAARLLADVSDATRAEVRAAMETALQPFVKGNVVALPAATWIVQAKNEG